MMRKKSPPRIKGKIVREDEYIVTFRWYSNSS